MADNYLRLMKEAPPEASDLLGGEVYRSGEPGPLLGYTERGPRLQRRIIGGPEGVGLYGRPEPTDVYDFSNLPEDMEQETGRVFGEEAGRQYYGEPKTLAYVKSEKPAAPAESGEIGTRDWAKTEWKKLNDDYNNKIAERKRIVSEGVKRNASYTAIERVLAQKGLDKIKEPKAPEWLTELAKERTVATPKGEISEKYAYRYMPKEEKPEMSRAKAIKEISDINRDIYELRSKAIEDGLEGSPELNTAVNSLLERRRYIEGLYGGGEKVMSREEADRVLNETELERSMGLPGGAAPDKYIQGIPGTKEYAPSGKPLDRNTAVELMREAGGDKELAIKLARERGYSLD